MAGRSEDSRRHELVKRALRSAAETADGDDRAFHDAFKAQAMATAARSGGGARSALTIRPRQPKGPRLADDSRFLSNVRTLTKRTMRNARIVGGSLVKTTEFQDCVAVGDESFFGCTGTLIAPDVVLTAAHCSALHTRIFVGNDVSKAGRIIKIKRHVRHPRFTKQFNNDLMLLFLEKKVTGVAPRKIASAALVDSATDGRIVGFGTTDRDATRGLGVKRQADVPIVSASCKGKLNGKADSGVYGCHRGLEIIASKPMLLRDTCEGDSGGPIFVADSRGQWLLAGVTSRGTNLNQSLCGDGGVYVRVDEYRSWIDSVIASQ